jgi:methyl-accepting chemotaxis protein
MTASSQSLSISARLKWMAVFVTIAVIGMSALSAWRFYTASLEQRLGTTRAVVQQAIGILDKYHQLESSGQMPRAEAQSKAAAEVKAIRYDGDNYIWINDMHPRIVAHPIKPELEGKDVTDFKDPDGKALYVAIVDEVKKAGAGYVDYRWSKVSNSEPVPKRSYVAGFAPWGWIAGSGVYIDDVRAAALQFAALSLGVGLFAAIAVFGFVLWTARTLRVRLAQAERALAALADGDLRSTIEIGARDELGRLLSAVAATRDNLARIVSQVRDATDGIQTASTEIASGNADLSERTEQAASSLQETASSMEQLTSTVRQTADSAQTANQLAQSASSLASKGGTVVSQVVSTMNEITASSKKIADIIGTIDGIAFQTNILALNAAVEAARAGEQGRGFAVVASEVRSLAQRSAEAAKEIKSLIGASVEKVESGSRLVADAGSTMGEIVAGVQRVSDIIAEISAATGEQSSGIAQVGSAVGQLDQATQQNAALVEESAAAAESLKDQARQLAQVVARFRVGDAAPAVTRPTAPRAAAAQVIAKARSAPAPATAPAAGAAADWETF